MSVSFLCRSIREREREREERARERERERARETLRETEREREPKASRLGQGTKYRTIFTYLHWILYNSSIHCSFIRRTRHLLVISRAICRESPRPNFAKRNVVVQSTDTALAWDECTVLLHERNFLGSAGGVAWRHGTRGTHGYASLGPGWPQPQLPRTCEGLGDSSHGTPHETPHETPRQTRIA